MVMCGEMGRPVASIFSLYVDMSRRAERVASDRACCIADDCERFDTLV
jgi:hypothetical protein